MIIPNEYDENGDGVSGSIIGYDQVADGYLSLTSVFDVPEVLVNNTYTQALVDTTKANQYFALTIGANEKVDYIGIAGHNMGDIAYTVSITKSVSPIPGTDVIAQYTATDNRDILLEFDEFTAAASNQIVVFNFFSSVSLTDDSQVFVSHVFVGKKLRMPTPILIGQDIPIYADKSDYEVVMSESGEMIGRSTMKKGCRATFSFRHVSISWYKQNFLPFVEHAKTKPFFLKWRPDRFTTETVFGYIEEDISATISNGAAGLLNITFTMSILNGV